MNLQELSDRAEIHDVLMRYFRGVDRTELELVRSCFHADAYSDYGEPFRGGVDEFIEHLSTYLPALNRTVHFAGNVLIELDGDTAQTETYVIAFDEAKPGHPWGDDAFVTIWVRYLDRLERRDGRWRIAGRRMVRDWRRHETTAGFAALVPPAEPDAAADAAG